MQDQNSNRSINKIKSGRANSVESQQNKWISTLEKFYRSIQELLREDKNLKENGISVFVKQGTTKVTENKLGSYQAPTLILSITNYKNTTVKMIPVFGDQVNMVKSNAAISYHFHEGVWYSNAKVGLFKRLYYNEIIQDFLGLIAEDN